MCFLRLEVRDIIHRQTALPQNRVQIVEITEDANMEKYDIIILAGQSNAVGFGCGETDYEFKNLSRIHQLFDDQAICYMQDDNGNDYLPIYRPWKLKLVDAADGHKTSLAMRFADDYIEKGYLAADRKILLLRCAVGGTGFHNGNWAVGELLYERMLEMIQYAISLNSENRIVAFLWHQGECDAFEGQELSYLERKEYYYNKLRPVIENVRKSSKQPKLPVVCGGIIDDWAKDYREQCDAVMDATKQICRDVGCAEFAEAIGLLSNDQKTGNGDNIHFCLDATYEL